MDTEQLIKLVKERRSLWDQAEKSYHVRNVHTKLWHEISKEMNEPVDAVKRRWRGLRDTFRKELKKELHSRGICGNDDHQKSSWAFFRQLYFLADMTKNMDSNVAAMEEDENSQSLPDSLNDPLHQTSPPPPTTPSFLDEGVVDKHEPSTSIRNKLGSSPLKRKRKWLWDECSYYEDKFLEIEDKKIKLLEEQGKQDIDGDQHFLNSILPFLNDIPKKRKLITRAKIIGVLIEELNRKESVPHNSTFPNTVVFDASEN